MERKEIFWISVAGVVAIGNLVHTYMDKFDFIKPLIPVSIKPKDEIFNAKPFLKPKGVIYITPKTLDLSREEKECLLKNIYFEAGVENFKGKLAVAQITINRMRANKWGKNICDVVFAKKQFSWTLEKKKVNSKPKGKLWELSKKAQEAFLNGVRVSGLENSMHYHTDYIAKPQWAYKKDVAMEVGQHIFYEK